MASVSVTSASSHAHRHPLLAKLFDRLGRFGVGVPAPVQHDGPGPPVGQPARDGNANPAQAAGHQIGSVVPQPSGLQRRIGQDHLADVPGGLHVLHRRCRLDQRPPSVYQWLQFTRRHLVHDPPEGVSGLGLIALLENVQLQDPVGNVGARRRHLLWAEDLHPGHLHKPTAWGQTRQAGVDEAGTGQAVQHQVNPFAPRSLEDLLAELGLAAVKHMLHAQRLQKGLLRSAGGGEYLGANGLGQLDGGHPHPAGPGVDQHPLAGFQAWPS